MGGRAADRLVYEQAFAGHENDLKEATRLARYMVTHWGMSERLGPMSFRVGEEHVFLGKEIQEPRDFSEGTAEVIDEEVQKLLREADQRAYEMLGTHRAELEGWWRPCSSARNCSAKSWKKFSARARRPATTSRVTISSPRARERETR